jgi:hypothetical protein
MSAIIFQGDVAGAEKHQQKEGKSWADVATGSSKPHDVLIHPND